MSKGKIFIPVLLSATLLFPVLSSPVLVNAQSAITQESVSQNQLASDFKFIFEEASTKKNGKYVLDEKKVAQKFGQENVASIAAFIKLANGEQLTAADVKNVPNAMGDVVEESWGSCMQEKILQYTGLGFLTGGMKELIEKKLWDKLAVEIIKIVGKSAIKGGVVGLAASLAWFSIACIGK
ncbi:hypothetical protein [Paenibacillus sp. 481]|uniref:hypothetical protein n=1 Tax=Paenibacillus sp. 481 TaxID=2835869 RepID=UPI001E3D8096|nr:hypothetical protein [Paenibacillus sp. 481]UHA74967.1 hypothetical protein KIK04_08030 [Paenibacillus sp. 481]